MAELSISGSEHLLHSKTTSHLLQWKADQIFQVELSLKYHWIEGVIALLCTVRDAHPRLLSRAAL